jgi:hypothetical protein
MASFNLFYCLILISGVFIGSILIMYLAISRTLSDKYMLVSKIPILSISLLIVMLNLIMRDDRYDNDYSSVKFLLAAALVEFLGFAVWQMYIVGTLLHPYLQHTMATVKVNIHRQSTRTAAFGVVTLGVSVVELMTPVLHSSGAHHYLLLFLGFVIILSLTLNFFDVIPSKGSVHALSISKLQGTAWMLMQPVLSYCIFGVGMIIKMLLAEDIDDTLHEQESDRTLGIFLGLASILLLLIRLTHRTKWTMTTARWVTAFCRLVIALGHLLVGFYLGHPMDVQVSLYSHAALCVAYVLVDALKYHDKDFLYLKIWSASAREDEDSVIIVESQHEEDDLALSSTAHSVKGSDTRLNSGHVVVLNRNLSEAKILIPEGLNDRKIHIPRRFASSSSIPGLVGGNGGGADLNGTKRIQVQRRPSDGKILLPRKHSEGKILLPRRPSEGKISLTRIQSEAKIQLPRTMSSSSFLTRSSSRNSLSGDDGERLKVKRIGTGKRKSLDVATGLRAPVTVTSPSNHINISRQYKSSTDIGHSRISAGQIRSISSLSSSTTSSPTPHGAVVKNDKGQFVLEQVVPTEDGGTRVQHTVLQRVVTKKSKKATEGLGNGSFSSSDNIPNSIVVRRIKSSGNVSKGEISDFDSAKLALQSSSSDSDDFGVEDSKESDERGTVNDIKESEVNPVVKMSPSITFLRTIDSSNSSKTGLCDEGDRSVGSSVVLIDDEETESANGALPLTTLSRGASLTLTDSGLSDSFVISEKK